MCVCVCVCICEIQIYHVFHKQNNGVFIKERKRINFPVIRVVILYRRDGSLHSCVCVCVCVCVVLTNTVVVEIFRFSNTMVFTKNCRCPNLHFLAPFSFSHFLQIKPSLSLWLSPPLPPNPCLPLLLRRHRQTPVLDSGSDTQSVPTYSSPIDSSSTATIFFFSPYASSIYEIYKNKFHPFIHLTR